MSSIEEKLLTFEELSAQFEQFEMDILDTISSVQAQLTELNNSSNWQDIHVSNFKDKYFNLYCAGLLATKNDAKSAKEFLQNKHESLSRHKN